MPFSIEWDIFKWLVDAELNKRREEEGGIIRVRRIKINLSLGTQKISPTLYSTMQEIQFVKQINML